MRQSLQNFKDYPGKKLNRLKKIKRLKEFITRGKKLMALKCKNSVQFLKCSNFY